MAFLLTHIYAPISRPSSLSHIPKPSSPVLPKSLIKSHATGKGRSPHQILFSVPSTLLGFPIFSLLFLLSAENTFVLTRDERLQDSHAGIEHEQIENSSTIAAIVTSMGGPPAAVGIVRLSGPRAVAIVGSLFFPAAKKKGKNLDLHSWRPTSHVVEYGVVLDQQGDVIDEVQ